MKVDKNKVENVKKVIFHINDRGEIKKRTNGSPTK
jgi:hypothetical protein